MKPKYLLIVTGFLILFIPFGKASIVVPFRNLGELTEAADVVVFVESSGPQVDVIGMEKHEYYPVKVVTTIKGDFLPKSFVKISTFHTFYDDMEANIWGDIKLRAGKRYLVFLKEMNTPGEYQALGLSYYVFEEKIIDGHSYLIPCEEGKEIHLTERPDGFHAEPLYDYKRDELLEYLSQLGIHKQIWNGKKCRLGEEEQKKLKEIQLRVDPPLHCTFLVVGPPWGRWQGFTGSPLPVKYQSVGDSTCSSTISYIQAAIPDLNSNYPGISMTDGGSVSGYVPNCTGGVAYAGNFVSFCNTNLGGGRNVFVIFNDPCHQIADLVSCSGTLAVGGSYSSGSADHIYQGISWKSNSYGFVVDNNNTGTCFCSNPSGYTLMFEHELTHTLGIGHISSGSGVANMNPFCCNSITALDKSCLEYSYSSNLPVELSSFKGQLSGSDIELNWETASERDNEMFILEYSSDGSNFQKIYSVAGAINSYEPQRYSYILKAKEGSNYFRLAQKDLNAEPVYVGNIVAINYKSDGRFDLNTHFMSAQELQLSFNASHDGELIFHIINSMGQTVLVKSINTEKGAQNSFLDLENLLPGWYNIHCTDGNQVHNATFIKSK